MLSNLQNPGAQAQGNQQPTGGSTPPIDPNATGGGTLPQTQNMPVIDPVAGGGAPVPNTQPGTGPGATPQPPAPPPVVPTVLQPVTVQPQEQVIVRRGFWSWKTVVAAFVLAVVLAVFLTGTFMRGDGKAKALPTFESCGSFQPKDPTHITAEDLKSFAGTVGKGQSAPSGRKIVSCSEGVQMCAQALTKGAVSSCDFSSCTCAER